MSEVSQPSRFPDTSMTLFKRIVSADLKVSEEAQEQFYRKYTPLMIDFLKSSGSSPEDAADFVQGFIHEQLHGAGKLKVWDASLGKLRNFLCARLLHYRGGINRKERAIKRGGDKKQTHESIDSPDFIESAGTEEDATRIFDRRWAEQIVQEMNARVIARYEEQGKGDEFRLLLANLESRSGNAPKLGYDEIGAQLGCPPNAVAQKMRQLRAIFQQTMELVVAETVAADDVDEEIDFVRAIVTGR